VQPPLPAAERSPRPAPAHASSTPRRALLSAALPHALPRNGGRGWGLAPARPAVTALALDAGRGEEMPAGGGAAAPAAGTPGREPDVPLSGAGPVVLAYKGLVAGTLLFRYDRFLARVRLDDGAEVRVHCPNTGPMLGLVGPREDRVIDEGGSEKKVRAQMPFAGTRVLMSDAGEGTKRKCRYTLEWVRPGRAGEAEWIGVHSASANHMAEAILANGFVPGLAGFGNARREVHLDGESRIDFELTALGDPGPGDGAPGGGGGPPVSKLFVEVKSVTLSVDPGDGSEGPVAVFPDTETVRGLKHVAALHAISLAKSGTRGSLLFVMQRGDCKRMAPGWAYDPLYSAVLSRAADAGMAVHAARCRLAWAPAPVPGALVRGSSGGHGSPAAGLFDAFAMGAGGAGEGPEGGRGEGGGAAGEYVVEFVGTAEFEGSFGMPGPEGMDKVDKALGRRLTPGKKRDRSGASKERRTTGYNLFMKSARPRIKEAAPELGFREVTRRGAAEWKAMGEEEKAPWNEAALSARQEAYRSDAGRSEAEASGDDG